MTILANPGLTIDQLRGALSLTHSGGVRLVDRLSLDGLVERLPGFGRSVSLTLTAAGMAAAEEVLAARERASTDALAALTKAERQQFGALAEKMLRRLVRSEAHGWQICRLCDVRACPQQRCPVEDELRRHPA